MGGRIEVGFFLSYTVRAMARFADSFLSYTVPLPWLHTIAEGPSLVTHGRVLLQNRTAGPRWSHVDVHQRLRGNPGRTWQPHPEPGLPNAEFYSNEGSENREVDVPLAAWLHAGCHTKLAA